MPRRWKLLLSIASISIGLDQLTKYWARAHFSDGSRQVVIDGYWDFVLAWNKGSAFSMFESIGHGRVLLSLVAAIAIGAIVWMVHKAEESQTGFVIALSLMAGGALGNLLDRIYFGKVTDFVLWKYHGHQWPVFNVADVVLVIAVGVFVLVSWKDRKAPSAEQDEAK